jgi:hypothetical protein
MAELQRSISVPCNHGNEQVDVTVEEYDDGTVDLVLTTAPPVLSVTATLDPVALRAVSNALRGRD